MIYQLGHISDLEKLPPVDGHIYEAAKEYLGILDVEYGADRNVLHGDGGFLLYCTPGTTDSELEAYFSYRDYVPEYEEQINSIPPYTLSVHVMTSDYGVVVLREREDEHAG